MKVGDIICSHSGILYTVTKKGIYYTDLVKDTNKYYLSMESGIIMNILSLTVDRYIPKEQGISFVQKTHACDCGGMKTYKTNALEFHSHWCSIRGG